MVSVCSVNFAYLDEVCDNFVSVPGMLFCSSFLINVCTVYVYCVESFAHIEYYSDCSHRGSHLVEL